MDITFNGWFIFVTVTTVLMYAGFYTVALRPRYNALAAFFGMLLTETAASLVAVQFQTQYLIKMPLYLTVELAGVLLLFKDKLLKKLISVFIVYFALLPSEILACVIGLLVRRGPIPDNSDPLINILLVVFTALFLYLGFRGLCLFNYTYTVKEGAKVLLIAASLLIVFLSTTFFSSRIIAIEEEFSSTVVYLIASFLASIAMGLTVFSLLNGIYRSRLAEQKNALLEAQMQKQLTHYAAYAQYQTATREMHHDIMRHMAAVKSLVRSGEPERAYRYADELAGAYEKASRVGLCENKLVDALLNDSLERAEADDIDCRVDVRLGDGAPFDDIDLICVFSNLIDNAFAACRRLSDNRFIDISAEQTDESLLIKLTNACLETDGTHPKARGTGTDIIEHVAEKYRGSFERRFEGGRCVCTCMLRF